MKSLVNKVNIVIWLFGVVAIFSVMINPSLVVFVTKPILENILGYKTVKIIDVMPEEKENPIVNLLLKEYIKSVLLEKLIEDAIKSGQSTKKIISFVLGKKQKSIYVSLEDCIISGSCLYKEKDYGLIGEYTDKELSIQLQAVRKSVEDSMQSGSGNILLANTKDLKLTCTIGSHNRCLVKSYSIEQHGVGKTAKQLSDSCMQYIKNILPKIRANPWVTKLSACHTTIRNELRRAMLVDGPHRLELSRYELAICNKKYLEDKELFPEAFIGFLKKNTELNNLNYRTVFYKMLVSDEELCKVN